MSKRKGARPNAPLALAASAPAVPATLRLDEIAMPTKQDRFGRAMSFGGITIDEMAAILRESETGAQTRIQDLYDFMLETDPHLSGACLTRILGVASRKGAVVPGKAAKGSPEEAAAKTVADFVQSALDEIPNFARVKKELLFDGVLKRYGVQEIMWERRDGAWLPECLKWRHPRRFTIGVDWDIRLYDQGKYGPFGAELVPNKYVVHVPKERPQYTTRCGVLHAAAWDWIFKKWIIKFSLSASERFGTPTPYGHVSEETPQVVREALRAGLEQLSAGQAAVFVGNTAIETLEAGAANPQIFQDMIGVFNANMSKLVLGSTLNVEGGPNGNRAAAESQGAKTIDPRIASDAHELEQTISDQLIRPIIEFNLHLFGGVMPPMPRYEFTLAEETETPLPPSVFVDGLFSVNEIRASYKHDPIPGAEGERRVNISAQQAPGHFSAEPTAPVGGRDAESPLASGLTSPLKNTRTSATFERFAATPIGRALSRRLDDRQS